MYFDFTLHLFYVKMLYVNAKYVQNMFIMRSDMKLAIIGSRSIANIEIGKFIPENVTEIISGGARGIDSIAREFANKNKIKLTEILPDYKHYGRAAPIIRNKEIVKLSDKVLAFWNGVSKGTFSVIKYAEEIGVECEVIIIN